MRLSYHGNNNSIGDKLNRTSEKLITCNGIIKLLSNLNRTGLRIGPWGTPLLTVTATLNASLLSYLSA